MVVRWRVFALRTHRRRQNTIYDWKQCARRSAFVFAVKWMRFAISSNIINSCAADCVPELNWGPQSPLIVVVVVHCVSFNLLLNKMISTFCEGNKYIWIVDAANALSFAFFAFFFSFFQIESKQIIIFIELANGQGAQKEMLHKREKFNSRFQTLSSVSGEFGMVTTTTSSSSRTIPATFFAARTAAEQISLPFIYLQYIL